MNVLPTVDRPSSRRYSPKPPWLKVRAPGGQGYTQLRSTLRKLNLHTVCEEARCPNMGECWAGGTATIMLLGDTCTRGCRFCHVKSAKTPSPPDAREPQHVGEAVAASGLDYVVLTMVDRDDLADGGAEHVAETVRAIKQRAPQMLVEVLTGDFAGDETALATVAHSGAEVLAHNLETVSRLQNTVRDARCSYELSLSVLRRYKALAPQARTKTSLMVGLGEHEYELVEAFADLRAHDVDMLTLGQYLQPSPRHLPVSAFVHPDQFDRLREQASAAGFDFVAAGPLVRSSYRAGELYVKGALDSASDSALDSTRGGG